MNDLDLYEAPEVASKMLVAAMGLIGSVTAQQRGDLWLSMDDPARQDWDIIPRPEHTGPSMHDLSASQRILVWDLIAAALPERTFTQATLVPELEHVLRDYEADFLGRALSSWRDPLNYFVTIFGRPGFEDTWAFRSPEVGAWEPMFPLLTVDETGFPHVCLLSRAELHADASGVYAALPSPTTVNNLSRRPAATLLVIAADSAYYLKLRVIHTGGSVLTGVVFEASSSVRDSLAIPLRPPRYLVASSLPVAEAWTQSAELLSRLARRVR